MDYLLPYIIIFCVLLFIIISIATSRNRVKKIYKKYMNITNSLNLTGKEFAFIAKRNLNLTNLKFALTKYELGDAYSTKNKTLIMSRQVCDTASISSIAIIAHELGHAVQDNKKSFLLILTHFFRSITRLTNKLIIPSFVIGLVCILIKNINLDTSLIFIYIGIGLFALHFLNHLLNIPLEKNASLIALKYLKNFNIPNSDYEKIKYLLNVAVQTYIASFFDDVFLFIFKRKR